MGNSLRKKIIAAGFNLASAIQDFKDNLINSHVLKTVRTGTVDDVRFLVEDCGADMEALDGILVQGAGLASAAALRMDGTAVLDYLMDALKNKGINTQHIASSAVLDNPDLSVDTLRHLKDQYKACVVENSEFLLTRYAYTERMEGGNLPAIRFLVEELGVPSSDEALYYASLENRWSLAEYLLQKGASPDLAYNNLSRQPDSGAKLGKLWELVRRYDMPVKPSIQDLSP